MASLVEEEEVHETDGKALAVGAEVHQVQIDDPEPSACLQVAEVALAEGV
jgi:hypothetical protein